MINISIQMGSHCKRKTFLSIALNFSRICKGRLELKKFKHRIKGFKHSLIRGKNYLDLKMKFPLFKSVMVMFKSLEIITLLTYIGLILQLTRVINFDFLQKILSYIPVTNSEINTRLVIAQISITFLILSLFSLISNIKKKRF